MRILIGNDHNGYSLKVNLVEYLRQLGHEVEDLGCDSATNPVDYPDVAVDLARRIARGDCARGILICGTGIGMAIAANKVPGVSAACCHDPYSAERARKSNAAQVLTLGAQIVAPTLARVLLDHWLASELEGGGSLAKVAKIQAIDDEQSRRRGRF